MALPQPSDGFEWTQAPWGQVLRCRALLPFSDHFFTSGSLQLRDDDGEWESVASLAGVTRDRLQLLRQVHGRTIVRATSDTSRARPEGDAVIGNDPSVALVVRVADCAPILLADRATGAVAAVHAGWRSTMQSIASMAVQSLCDTFGSRPQDLLAAIGPSLGVCCGEMGDEVVAAFRAAGYHSLLDQWFLLRTARRPHFDLWRANRDQLEQAGVPSDSIHVAGLCTRTHRDVFHSYRAAGHRAGRMAGVIRPNR